jgi:hypothetical protein
VELRGGCIASGAQRAGRERDPCGQQDPDGDQQCGSPPLPSWLERRLPSGVDRLVRRVLGAKDVEIGRLGLRRGVRAELVGEEPAAALVDA